MKYAFLSTLIPKELTDEVAKLSEQNMQDAANALQWHVYEGLCENLGESFPVFNILPIGSFPQYYKKAFICQQNFRLENHAELVNIGFCNIKGVRRRLKSQRIHRVVRKWCKSSNDEKVLFVYTISDVVVSAIEKLKNEFPQLKVCAIVADLPNMSSLSSKKKFYHKILSRNIMETVSTKLSYIDSFVLLTKYMADYLNIEQPFCVMEGISTEINQVEGKVESFHTKTIMYSGTLHRKFGVLILLEAFKKIEDSDFRLIICGIGDSEAEIREAADKDSRIVFKGQLPREEVLALQQEATVLINPRQNTEEFTKYSFPSKNLEYLSSGKPLVAYKLDGIPDEYDEYINYVKDNSVEALYKKIVEVCNDIAASNEKSMKAREFVLQKKNSVVQTKNIIDMLHEAGIIQNEGSVK